MSFQCTTSLPRGFDRRSHEEPWAPTRARRSFCRKDLHVVFFHERYWVVFRAICQAHIQWCHLPGRSWKCVGWGGARGRNTRSIIIIVVIIIIIVIFFFFFIIFFFFFFLQFEYNDVKCKSFNDGLWDNEDEKTKPFGNLLSFVLSRRKNIFCYRLPSLIASHRKKNAPECRNFQVRWEMPTVPRYETGWESVGKMVVDTKPWKPLGIPLHFQESADVSKINKGKSVNKFYGNQWLKKNQQLQRIYVEGIP